MNKQNAVKRIYEWIEQSWKASEQWELAEWIVESLKEDIVEELSKDEDPND